MFSFFTSRRLGEEGEPALEVVGVEVVGGWSASGSLCSDRLIRTVDRKCSRAARWCAQPPTSDLGIGSSRDPFGFGDWMCRPRRDGCQSFGWQGVAPSPAVYPLCKSLIIFCLRCFWPGKIFIKSGLRPKSSFIRRYGGLMCGAGSPCSFGITY